MPESPLGRAVRRNEDPRLLTGRALFVDDIELAGMAHVAFVRSPYAHARLGAVEVGAALEMEGVIAAFVADDLGDYWQHGPLLVPPPPIEGAIFHQRTQVPLARDKVRHQGEAIAVVVAESRALAEDAAERVEVDYQPLPAVVDIVRALDQDAALVHEDVGSNVAAHIVQTKGDYESSTADAAVVIRRRLSYDRGASAAIENRGVVAEWDSRAARMTVWDTTQAPIPIRSGLAAMLGLNESQVRVVAPFIGGGFGPKIMMFYPEEVLIPWLARELDRPVKWIEDRSENFVATTQERGQIHDAELALTADGRILGLKDSFLHDTGAYDSYGLTVPLNSQCTALGPYAIPAYESEFKAVFTNKITVTPYRGAGRQHGVFVIERLLDFAADELGIERTEIRRRNFLHPDDFPLEQEILYQDFAPLYYDSGNYEPILDRALEMIGYRDFIDSEQPRLRAAGRQVGIGVVPYVEGTGIGPYEGARVQVHSDSKISVATGIGTQGQGHFTVLAQVAAEQLGVAVEDIHVVTGDTDQFHWGSGTFASRGAVVAGNAVHQAAAEVRQKALGLASRVLEAEEEALEFVAGSVRVAAEPERSVTLGQLADDANPLRGTVEPGTEPGLEATCYFGPYRGATASGVHAMIVEVDPETMELDIHKYVVVHDCGKVLNPLIVDGQIHGGVAQGIGNAYYEQLVFDDNGQLLNASLMDFLLPTALDVPRIDVGHLETPSPLNPLGSKGAGEAGAIPTGALFAQALENALQVKDFEIHEIPLSPNRLWELVREARGEQPTVAAESKREHADTPTRPAPTTAGGRALRLAGDYIFAADPTTVWEALLDPNVLSRTLPGCERLERVGDNSFEGLLNIQVGPVKARFQGTLELSNLRPAEGYHLRLNGRGPAGFMSAEGDLTLEKVEGGTRLTYDLTAGVGGTLAGVGQRLLESSARVIASIGLEGLAAQILAREGTAGGEPAAAPAAPTAAAVTKRVAKEVAKDLLPPGRRRWALAGLVGLAAVLIVLIRACG